MLERPGFHASARDGVSKPANYGIEVTAGLVQRVNIEAVKDTIAVRRQKAKAGINPMPRVVHNTPARRSQGSDVATRSTGTWFVYILRCADGTLYTGVTKDLARRTQQHNVGTAARYTRSRRPVKLLYQEPQRSQSLALKREAAIKKLTRRQKLALIGFTTPRSESKLSASRGQQVIRCDAQRQVLWQDDKSFGS